MELNEAIEHATQTSRNLKAEAKEWQGCAIQSTGKTKAKECLECAAEHEQLAEWLTELQERREADRWIPVSESLPEPQKPNDDIYNPNCSDYVLVCIEWWNGQKDIDIACYIFDDEEWEYQGSDESEVIAWKPLPKPYESEDNQC